MTHLLNRHAVCSRERSNLVSRPIGAPESVRVNAKIGRSLFHHDDIVGRWRECGMLLCRIIKHTNTPMLKDISWDILTLGAGQFWDLMEPKPIVELHTF